MKKIKKLLFIAIFSLCLVMGISAAANDYDFYEEKSFTGEDAEELATKELESMLEKAKAFEATLDDCSSLEIIDEQTGIFTEVEDLAEETVETSEEKEEIVSKHTENGYVVEVVSKDEDTEEVSYSFEVENGVIRNALVDDEEEESYVGMKLVSVLADFVDEDVEDYKIVYTTTTSVTPVEETETVRTYEELSSEISNLEDLGYDVKWVQNDKETYTETIRYQTEKTKEGIISELEEKYSNLEVKDVVVSDAKEITTNVYTPVMFSTKDLAEDEQKRLQTIYDYVSDVKTKETTYEEKVKVKTGENKVASDVAVESVDFEVTTDGVRVENEDESGYKVYRLISNGTIISAADSIERNFLTKSECNSLKTQYEALGWRNLTCTAVTITTLEKNTSNKYIFNSEMGTSMSWVHLDISVEQEIVLYEENGTTVKEKVTGTIIEAPKAWLNKGTNDEVAITYNNKSSADGDRYEYRSKTNSSFSYDDYVTLQFKIRYKTSDGAVHEPTIVLEGYLKNIFNVCKDKNNSRERGFDLEISISVDADGNEVVNFTTSTVYTFTAEKDAKYADKIVYDEYEYVYTETTETKKSYEYYVEAHDIDYSYVVNYVKTDYSYTYTGEISSVSVVRSFTDRYFLIKGSKTTYIARVAAMIVTDEMCNIGDEGEPILPPHTGLNSELVINYDNVAIIEDKKRRK